MLFEPRWKMSIILISFSFWMPSHIRHSAQKALVDVLTLLIEEFEERHYALKSASPIEHIVELMTAHDLKPKDLVDIFGTPSIVSEVLHGKRQLTTEHIRRLSERFHVTPGYFCKASSHRDAER